MQATLPVDLGPYTVEEYETREKWIAGRGDGVGGSEAAVLWDASPFDSLYSLWAKKVAPSAPAEDEAEWLEIGTELEEPIARLYARRTGHQLIDPGRTVTFRSTEWPWMRVQVDRIIVPPEGERGVLECKNRGAFAARDWSDGVPLDVESQVQHALAVTGLRWASVAALVGGNHFVHFPIKRNDEFIAMHVERCRAFMQMVESKTAPPIDDSAQTAAALRRLYAREVKGKIVTLPPDALAWAEAREEAKEAKKVAEKRIQELDILIRDAMGDAEAGTLADGSCFTLKTVNKKEHMTKASSYRELRWRKASSNE